MIEAHDLVKRYGSAMAVSDLSFSVRPGMVTGFLGRTAPGSPPHGQREIPAEGVLLPGPCPLLRGQFLQQVPAGRSARRPGDPADLGEPAAAGRPGPGPG
jgi:hypothetical protein